MRSTESHVVVSRDELLTMLRGSRSFCHGSFIAQPGQASPRGPD